MKNTCQIGNLTEARLLIKFVEKCFNVFLPYGEGHKVDLIFINDKNQPKRVQIKTCRETRQGTLIFNIYSNGGGYNKITYTKDNIDYFATEFEGVCYLIPIEDINNKTTLTMNKINKWIF